MRITPEAMLGASGWRHAAVARGVGCGAGFAQVRAAWLERAGPVGEACTVNTGTERIAGTFVGLDPGGALLLRDRQGQRRTVTFGDVTLAAAASGEAG